MSASESPVELVTGVKYLLMKVLWRLYFLHSPIRTSLKNADSLPGFYSNKTRCSDCKNKAKFQMILSIYIVQSRSVAIELALYGETAYFNTLEEIR